MQTTSCETIDTKCYSIDWAANSMQLYISNQVTPNIG